MYVYNAFTKADIVLFANDVLTSQKRRIRVTDIEKVEGDVAVAVTSRGGRLALIMCSFSTLSVMAFRSINKIKNKNKRWTYLFNGQAGTNLEPIVFTGEQGKQFYANLASTAGFFNEVYKNIVDEKERLEQVNKRVSWEAKGNHVIQNDLIDGLTMILPNGKVNKAFDYNSVVQGEVAILFSINTRTGDIVDKWVGELNLPKIALSVSADKQYFLTKTVAYNKEKVINALMARSVWDHLGNIPTDEDGEMLDQDFLHFSVGDDVHDVWCWVESEFDISIGDDILCAGKGEVA